MLKHILKLTFRNIIRHRSSFLINLIGLSTGLACAFMIYLWINDELNFDKFHKNDPQLYQVMEMSTENGDTRVQESTQGLLASTMAKDLPEVKQAVSILNLAQEEMSVTLTSDNKVSKELGLFAEKDFFEIFTFPLLQGDKKTVLNEKESILISEKVALQLFGSAEAAIGQPVEWALFGKNQISTCTGVFADVPANSSLQFDFVLTGQKLLEDIWTNGQKWWNTGSRTFLVLNPQTDVKAFNKKIERFVDKYDKGNFFSLFVRPYSSSYLKGEYNQGVQEGGRIVYVKLFALIAILVLVIACVNFMNLSTARASRRLKEIGIKKAVGGNKKSLIFQFLTESVITSLISALAALVLILLAIPQFNFITGKSLSMDFSPRSLCILFIVSMITGLLSGSYPAFYLSGFDPVSTLKGKLKGKIGELFIRKGLVIFQFSISLVLIISVFVIRQQIAYAQSKPSGYNKDNLIYFELDGTAYSKQSTFLKEIESLPEVKNTGLLSQTLLREDGGSSTYGIDWPGQVPEDNIDFIIRGINEGSLKTLGIKMKEGKSFSNDLGANESYLLINETAAEVMKLAEPIGTKVKLWGEDKTILGVMKDFHTASIHKEIAPLIFRYQTEGLGLGLVKITTGKEREALDKISKMYTDYNPGYTFNFSFFDDTYKAQYISETRIAKLSSYFAALAILISCLGLLGLASFNTEIRAKEIGVRKVLGASSLGIITLLTKDFIKLVLIAIFVAIPIAAYFMNDWLAQYAYKIDLQWWIFAIAALMALLIASLTVGLLSLKTAMTNPVKSLRSE